MSSYLREIFMLLSVSGLLDSSTIPFHGLLSIP